MDLNKRSSIKIGMLVDIVKIEDRLSQNHTRGYVMEIISNSNTKKGILVKLTTGEVGNVKKILTQEDIKSENFKFWNLFFYSKQIYTIWDKKNKNILVINHKNKYTSKIEKTSMIFDSENIAKDFIKDTIYDNSNYMISRLNMNKRIHENLKKINIDVVRININKRVFFDRFIELENHFHKF